MLTRVRRSKRKVGSSSRRGNTKKSWLDNHGSIHVVERISKSSKWGGGRSDFFKVEYPVATDK